jgi:hypothetical protein
MKSFLVLKTILHSPRRQQSDDDATHQRGRAQ